MNPRPESRISSLEKRAATVEAAIEELSSDTAEGLKAVGQDVKRVEDGMLASFKQIGELFDRNFERFDAIETRLDQVEQDITGIKTDVAGIKTTQERILELVQKKLGD